MSDLYQRLGALIASAPKLDGDYGATQQAWLGQASALLDRAGDLLNKARFDAALGTMNYPSTRAPSSMTIMQTLYVALAAANADAPLPLQGAFLPVGNTLDALKAVANVLTSVSRSVMFVDPYADTQVLSTFAVQAAESVSIRVLSDTATVKAGLKPAVVAWASQYAAQRPLEVRLAPARALHDRLIVVDESSAWLVGQSFNSLATRAPTVITRLDGDTGALKIAAHIDIWSRSTLI